MKNKNQAKANTIKAFRVVIEKITRQVNFTENYENIENLSESLLAESKRIKEANEKLIEMFKEISSITKISELEKLSEIFGAHIRIKTKTTANIYYCGVYIHIKLIAE